MKSLAYSYEQNFPLLDWFSPKESPLTGNTDFYSNNLCKNLELLLVDGKKYGEEYNFQADALIASFPYSLQRHLLNCPVCAGSLLEVVEAYERTRQPCQLAEAIEARTEDLETATHPEHQLFRIATMNNLGNDFLRQYRQLPSVGDIDSVINLYQVASALLPKTEQPFCYAALSYNLAVALLYHYELYRQSDDLAEIKQKCRVALDIFSECGFLKHARLVQHLLLQLEVAVEVGQTVTQSSPTWAKTIVSRLGLKALLQQVDWQSYRYDEPPKDLVHPLLQRRDSNANAFPAQPSVTLPTFKLKTLEVGSAQLLVNFKPVSDSSGVLELFLSSPLATSLDLDVRYKANIQTAKGTSLLRDTYLFPGQTRKVFLPFDEDDATNLDGLIITLHQI